MPTASAAWRGSKFVGHDEGWIRPTHRIAAWCTVMLAISVLVLLIGRRIRARERGIVAGVGVLATALAASFTGYLLPWDQLALWAVTVGRDITGVQATFRAEVKYILIGSREVSMGTYRFWAIAHVVLGVLLAVTLLLAWLRTRRVTVAATRERDQSPTATGSGTT